MLYDVFRPMAPMQWISAEIIPLFWCGNWHLPVRQKLEILEDALKNKDELLYPLMGVGLPKAQKRSRRRTSLKDHIGSRGGGVMGYYQCIMKEPKKTKSFHAGFPKLWSYK